MIPPHSSEADYNGNGHSSSPATLLVPARRTLPIEPLADWQDSKSIWSAEPQQQGINPLEFLRALRRRWLLALGVSLGAALAAMALAFLLIPQWQEVQAVLRVLPSAPSYVLEKGAKTLPAQEIERVHQNEIQNLKSKQVLEAALKLDKVKATSIYQENKADILEYLNEELRVGFRPNTDLMVVSMKGDNVDELIAVVDGIVNAYEREFGQREKADLRDKIETLRTQLQQRRADLTAARTTLNDLIQETGMPHAAQGKVLLDLAMNELSQKTSELADVQRKANDAFSRMLLEQDKLKQIKNKGVPDSIVDQGLAKDPAFAELKAQALQYEQAYRLQANRGRGGGASVNQYAQAYQSIMQQINDYRRREAKLVKKANEDALELNVHLAKSEANILAQRAAIVKKEVDKLTEELKNKGTANEAMADAEDVVNRSKAFDFEKSALLDDWLLELKAPQRITIGQSAMIPPEGINTYLRWWLTFGAGFMTFALSFVLVGAWEYFNRRLGNVNEVAKHLNLNLVGTVPALPKRPGAKVARGISASQFDALLADSIDSIRATLLHGANSNGHRTVMVTSAWDGEGKTTVASQLAASLARCGRRTLLVDGDIRNPTLHQLFELPVDVGLCEILRGEVEPRVAARETPAENLWLLSTGACDERSIQALETDGLARVFSQLKAEYDFVVVDTAPVLAFADALMIGQQVDGAILSVRLDHTQRPKVEEAASRLRSVGVHIFGAVVNGTKAVASRRAAEQPALVE